MKSLDELPASDVLSSRQIDKWLKNATNPAAAPTDTDMGLADEQLPWKRSWRRKRRPMRRRQRLRSSKRRRS